MDRTNEMNTPCLFEVVFVIAIKPLNHSGSGTITFEGSMKESIVVQ